MQGCISGTFLYLSATATDLPGQAIIYLANDSLFFKPKDGLIVKEWWLSALYRLIPSIFYSDTSVPTPLMFLSYLDKITSSILQGVFGLPTVVFDDSFPYSLNKLALYLFGVNIFQMVGIALLAFIASIALVMKILFWGHRTAGLHC